MSALGRPGSFAGVLERWWEPVRPSRDELSWRSVRDPWGVLVAETMLAQTQAQRVNERYGSFVRAFPSPVALSVASPAEVLRAWSGLGYNRRALQLQAAAAAIVERHGGEVPAELEALLALPGVGPYIARAVASLAFDVDVAVLDTNVGRVLARSVAGMSLQRRTAQELADSLVPRGRSATGICCSWTLAVSSAGRGYPTVRPVRSPKVTAHGATTEEQILRRIPPRSRGPRPDFPAPIARSTAGSSAAASAAEIVPAQLVGIAGIEEEPERLDRIVSQLIAEGMLERTWSGGLVLAAFRGAR